VPVALRSCDYQRAHDAAHKSALIWNQLVKFQKNHWNTFKADPGIKVLRYFVYSLDPSLLELHAHTKQAIVDDLLDATATYRENRKAGNKKARAPWREKNYRPLTFTRGFGWRVIGETLNLSLGLGRSRIKIGLPEAVDPCTGNGVPVALWGEIKLCWNIDARKRSVHIAVPVLSQPPALDPAKLMAIDEGIINPMSVAVKTEEGFTVSVINGRQARAVKDRRNRTVAELRSLMAECTNGSLQWRRYNKALQRAQAKAAASLRNIDHQVSRKVAQIAQANDTGQIAIGDVREIEKNSRRAERRRCDSNQRRRLSQWSRGRQEEYLKFKTGLDLQYIKEAFSSKTCPACLTRNRPRGRNYQCRECGFSCHRDAVGAVNIWMRATWGEYRPIDREAIIKVIYLRAIPLKTGRKGARSTARNLATGVDGGSGADRTSKTSAIAVPGPGQPQAKKPGRSNRTAAEDSLAA
jgi:putative transposase